MNIELENYLQDGANYKARAIMCILQGRINEIKDADGLGHSKDVMIHIGRFENCREQGYVFTLFCECKFIKNYAVYEHRNSDNICVLVNDSFTMNTPNANTMFGDRGKYDVDAMFQYDEIMEASNYIVDAMIKDIQQYYEEKEAKNEK